MNNDSDDNAYVTKIEQELIEATNFVPEKKYRKRQDYLAALMRAVCDLDDDSFEKLSDPAADWSSAAVEAFKAKDDLPDFRNGEDHEAGDALDIQTDISESEETVNTSQDEEITDQELKTEKKKPGRPKGSKSKAKGAKAKGPKEPKEPKEPRAKKVTNERRGLNKWGVLNGSKSDVVCQMLAQEGGTTMKDIIDATGQAHYNLCNRLQRHGYKLVKNGLNIRLISE